MYGLQSLLGYIASLGFRPVRSTKAAPPAGGPYPRDDELDEVLRGSFAADTYNRAIRVLAWAFILIALLIVWLSQLWQPVQPQIFATLILAGVVLLVLHELMPFDGPRTARVLGEGSLAVVFVTMLVLLTGNAASPFAFVYSLLVGGLALIAAPRVTLVLAIEGAVAYTVACLAGPTDADGWRDLLARFTINVTALLLLAYGGMVVSRVQHRTRAVAIRLSTVDSLTDLYNRAYFFNSLDREIRRAGRYGRGFCLLMIDLDGLKSINDRHGHYQGDEVLRGVAEAIRTSLRAVDTPARYGGDEFVALLPETDPAGAGVVAEKLRLLAGELRIGVGDHRVRTSVSIGIVAYPDDGRTADELMIAADEAMYSAKRLGRNRIVRYSGRR